MRLNIWLDFVKFLYQLKIVMSILERIPVEISFNKVGGLSTLCFMERFDSCIPHIEGLMLLYMQENDFIDY